MTSRTPPPEATRPLLGLRRRPGRLALVLMRLPLRAYRSGHGNLLGHAFVAFTHLGRRTGLPHEAVAMVLDEDRASGEVVICAAWGPATDWYRNLQEHPATRVQVGRRSFTPVQRLLTEGEALQSALIFRAKHPHRLRLISRVLGWGDLREDEQLRDFVRRHPFVGFRPDEVNSSPPW